MEITLNDVSYRYSRKAPYAVQGVTATINPGIHLLLGENGAGKTTLLHLIAGLLTPGQGQCLIDGTPSCYRLPSILSRTFICGVNIDFPMRSIREMVKVHAPFYPGFDAEMLRRNLAAFDIEESTPLSALSTGNAQKAKIAYALALRTPILLLDEPTNGVDIESKKQLQRMIAECVSEEQTVIISTHSIADLENFYDGVIDMCGGRLQYAMTVDELLDHLDFGVADKCPENAIYAEPWIGRFRFVLAKADTKWTDIDFEMLYMATRKANTELLKALNR